MNTTEYLVESGPGTGKTTWIVNEVIPRLNRKDKVIATTFTRASGKELRDRLAIHPSLEKGAMDSASHIGTIHSLAIRLYASVYPSVRLGNDEDMAAAIDDVKRVYTRATAKGIREAIASGSIYGGELDLYREACMMRGFIDPDVLIWEACRVIKLGKVQSHSGAHVYVDEAQDITLAESTFIRALNPATISWVGDPYQAIYAWRNMGHGGWQSIVDRAMKYQEILTSYRIPEPIVSWVNRIHKVRRDISSGKKQAGVIIYEHKDDLEKYGIPELKNTVFICRTNRECDYVRSELGIVSEDKDIEIKIAKSLAKWYWVANCYENDFAVKFLFWVCHGLSENHWLQHAVNGTATKVIQPEIEDIKEDGADIFAIDYVSVGGDRVLSARIFDACRDETWQETCANLERFKGLPTENAGIEVTTVHGAKGREWDHVNVWDPKSFEGKKEGENLLYVACTRAKKSLTLWDD